MLSFRRHTLPGRVVFGAGRSRSDLASEVDGLGVRPFVIASQRAEALTKELTEPLGDRVVGRFTDVREHVPRETADAARDAVHEARADCLLSIGGGSVVGTAKAVAVEARLPILAVPTTYAGSEMTPTWGMTESGRKRTNRSADALPRTVIYDPELTVSLPATISAASGMNALAHCVGAGYLPGSDPITKLIALEGIRALADGLPTVVSAPDDLAGRSWTLYGAYLAGSALAVVGPATHHRVCHVLGGAFGLPHAQTHSVILPYVARVKDGELFGVAEALGAHRAGDGLRALAERIGAPTSLAAIGMRADDLEQAIELVGAAVPLDARALLVAAFDGRW